jgi:hypothetical protein
MRRRIIGNEVDQWRDVYVTPFDLIFARTTNEEWRAQGDYLRTFLGDFVASLTDAEFPL